MTRWSDRLCALLALLAVGGGAVEAHATPTRLDATDFAAAISGPPTQVEDFEGFAVTNYSSPFTFANGTYSTSLGDAQISSFDLICGTSADQCMTNTNEMDVKTIDGLPAGTVYWGASMSYVFPSNDFEVVVTGGSGTLTVTEAGPAFLGFHDPLGITSVTFENVAEGSTGNFSWDDVTTTQIPEPSTLGLVAMGLAFLALARR